MIHAYQEIYLNKAQSTLGDAFDYAINTCGISGNDFVKLFTASSVGKRLENGEPACLAGKSGMELVIEIIAETKAEGRRRSYIITDKGKEMLAGEYERLRRQAVDYEMIFRKEQSK